MSIRIKTTGYELPEATRTYLEERLAAVEKLVPGGEPLWEVELSREGSGSHGALWRAEVNLSHDGDVYRAENTAETMHAAIDAVKDDLMHQLRKEKTKYESSFRKGARTVKDWLRFGEK
ncbi:MAG: ribosome-associated translation inhibitor RaiA [Candidatus Pacebacteria bacterium]|nr:ribosome-associated translation inhibitor RaiA [Candidatus Paceibacterota bacterium]